MIAAIGRKRKVEKCNVLVFGAGAIGTYIGGSLALTGQHVVFLEQPAVVDELLTRGLRLVFVDSAQPRKLRLRNYWYPRLHFYWESQQRNWMKTRKR